MAFIYCLKKKYSSLDYFLDTILDKDLKKNMIDHIELLDILTEDKYSGVYSYTSGKFNHNLYATLEKKNLKHKFCGFIDGRIEKQGTVFIDKPVVGYDSCRNQENNLFIISPYFLEPKYLLEADNKEYVIVKGLD